MIDIKHGKILSLMSVLCSIIVRYLMRMIRQLVKQAMVCVIFLKLDGQNSQIRTHDTMQIQELTQVTTIEQHTLNNVY